MAVPGSASSVSGPEYKRHVDDLVQLYWGSITRTYGAKGVIHRPVSDGDRKLLQEHRIGLRKYLSDHNRSLIGSYVSGMLGCYTQFLSFSREESERFVVKYVQELQGVPTWAVGRACYNIRTNRAEGVSMVHPPSTMMVRHAAEKLAEPFRIQAAQIDNIMAAEPYVEPLGPAERKMMQERLEGLVRHLASAADVDPVGDTIRDRNVRRMTESSRRFQEREYIAAGVEPPKGAFVSPSLAKLMGKWPKSGTKKAATG